jgi:endonuclease/exonuclease/phosphatase (EEP) superfamily protein YafD
MLSLAWSLGIFCVISTALPFIRAPYWWIRIFDFPRVQVAALCLISLILIFIYKGDNNQTTLVLGVLVTASLVYQLTRIIVYTKLYPVQAKASKKKEGDSVFGVIVANIRMYNKKSAAVLDQINKYDPDIVLLTEPNKRWVDDLKEIESRYPYIIPYPLENTYGMVLYSKLELKNPVVNFLVDKEIPSFFATVVLRSGEKFDLHAVHPKPPQPGTESYERDTEILLIGKTIRERDTPAIVIGDLNDVSWSTTTKRFQKYSRLGDPRQGRSLFNTYNAHVPLFRFPLDHIFYSDSFGLVDIEKLGHNGSDHFPMFIRLSFEPEKDNVDELPDVDAKDKEVISETYGINPDTSRDRKNG